jgi:hypothetical protein
MDRSRLLVVLVLAGCGGNPSGDAAVSLLASRPAVDIEFAVVRDHDERSDPAAASRLRLDVDATRDRLVFGYLPAEAAELSF